MLAVVERDFQIAAENIQKLLAFMSVRFAAAGRRSDSKQMGFHHGVPPSQQFHLDTRTGTENLPVFRLHPPGIRFRWIEERKNVELVEAREAAQGGNRGAHLLALDST